MLPLRSAPLRSDPLRSAYERMALDRSASLRLNPLRLTSLAYTNSRSLFPVVKAVLFGTHVVPSGGLFGHPILDSSFPEQPAKGNKRRIIHKANTLVFMFSDMGVRDKFSLIIRIMIVRFLYRGKSKNNLS